MVNKCVAHECKTGYESEKEKHPKLNDGGDAGDTENDDVKRWVNRDGYIEATNFFVKNISTRNLYPEEK